jgi:hypothetical protein
VPEVSLEGAVDLTRTGDVWVFRGGSVADLAIRTLTNAPVNHVGMAVVLEDLPPLLWHAELGRSLPDVSTGATKAASSCTTWRTPSAPGGSATGSGPGCASWWGRPTTAA